jgi:hypothetical protein
MALLEVSLSEIAMETQFYREEWSQMDLTSKESKHLMAERMYRARMEVSLFNTAMVNLCEEMNTRGDPRKPYCSEDYSQC